MRYLITSLISFVLGVLFAISLPALAYEEVEVREVLNEFKRAYIAGDIDRLSVLVSDDIITDEGVGKEVFLTDYADLFNKSTDRYLRLYEIGWDNEFILARFDVTLTRGSDPVGYSGTLALAIQEGQITQLYYTYRGQIDMVEAGQLEDSVTTGAAVFSAGFVEANPVLSGIVSHPAGLVAVAVAKIGFVRYGSTLPVQQCVNWQIMAGTLGWFATAWNIGMFVSPPAAAILGIVGFELGQKLSTHDSLNNCKAYVRIQEI